MKLFQKLYKIEARQFIPIGIDEAWDFFRSPKNLSEVTPSDVGFNITSISGKGDDVMYEGMLINYVVSPFPFAKMRWCTEITHIQDKKCFIDEQRFGPYKMWHHEHWFEETKGGIIAIDQVYYGIPLGIIGQLMNGLVVKGKLKEIFDFRSEALQKKWPGTKPAEMSITGV